MFGRILLIMALVGVGIWLLRKALNHRKPPAPPADAKDSPDALVKCAHCGIHLPQVDAVWKEGRAFCSMTHRHLGPKNS